MPVRPIVLCTDYGVAGPYVGQLKLALYRQAPSVPTIDLCHDLPPFQIPAAATLLAVWFDELPPDGILLAVVDPGVGGTRAGVVVQCENRLLVGPDNGLFTLIAAEKTAWRLDWQPPRLSASFHGRDLFAPIAAQLATQSRTPADCGPPHALTPLPAFSPQQILYIDPFGNAMTGLRACEIPETALLQINGHDLQFAPTFCTVPLGQPFWYENANGLVEIACNQGHAAQQLGLKIGSPLILNGLGSRTE